MADLISTRYMIQQEETRAQAAVSESTMSRVGSSVNFINTKHIYQHDWNLNGRYNIVTPPNLALDSYITYPFPYEILEFMVFSGDAMGSSGITELDVKWKPELSGTYQSIFSTTPKLTSAAGAFESIRQGQTRTGWTAPVLSKTQFDAYDILRLDLLQAQAGNPNGVFAKVWIRPINQP